MFLWCLQQKYSAIINVSMVFAAKVQCHADVGGVSGATSGQRSSPGVQADDGPSGQQHGPRQHGAGQPQHSAGLAGQWSRPCSAMGIVLLGVDWQSAMSHLW